MKKIIKQIIMILSHPYIFIKKINSNNLFIGSKSDIRKISQIMIGNNVRMGKYIRINFFSNNSKLIIEDGVYMVNRISLLVGDNIKIGKNTLIASDVCICSENHGINPESDISYKNQQIIMKKIVIGEGCWIGEKSTILAGVKIGNKCVIGAGSVVTKDVPDYCIAVGNPARVIKKYNFDSHSWESVN